MDEQPAGEAAERAREREGPEPLPVNADADRLGGCRILARRPHHPAERAALVGERTRDDEQRADRRLERARRLRDEREGRRARPDLDPLAQQVVRDLEHSEGRDPGREPGQAHQRQSDEEGEDSPDRGRERQRGDVPDRVLAQQREELRQHARLRLERHRHHPGRERADRDEADLAEREHAGAADEDVDRDDDGDGDERVQEVDLVRAGHVGRADPDGDDERRGAEQSDRVVESPHTRSTTVARPRAKSPAGRSSKTPITRANTTEGRKTVLSVGSAPLITPLAKPIAKPPSVAVQSRSMPPTTTPTSTTIVSLSAKSGVTSGNWTVRITATVAASTPERSTAIPITESARTPSRRAVRKSAAAARMCRPIVVFASRSASSPSVTTATTTARIVTFLTSTPRHRHGLVERGDR